MTTTMDEVLPVLNRANDELEVSLAWRSLPAWAPPLSLIFSPAWFAPPPAAPAAPLNIVSRRMSLSSPRR
ncbi:hypothetical protein ACH4UR_25650 [Streptomyces lydicus]|uniref:hypothetical protein n=1 Tax=Streptomyces lydicus TaxID=47763 RepID=UPI0033F3CEB6